MEIVKGDVEEMRAALELIACRECEAIQGGRVHVVKGDAEGSGFARFYLDTCPVCLARKALMASLSGDL